MKTVYCLSGLGADERIFQKLDVPGISFRHINWVQPLRDETIHEYARRVSSQVADEHPILLGVSFGGMMAIEIARLIPVEKTILIASIKSFRELPWWMNASGKCRLDKMLPARSLKEIRPLKMFRPLRDYFLGATDPEMKKLANEFRDNVDPVYLKWAIHEVLNWKNDWQPDGLFHIHGSHDHIFPLRRSGPTHIVKNAGHMMVMSHPWEISRILEEIIFRGK